MRGRLGGPGARLLAVDAGAAAVLAVALLPWSLRSLAMVRQPVGWTVTVVVAIAVLHGTVAARRVAPIAGYVVACGAMLVVVLAPIGRIAHPEADGYEWLPMLFLPSTVVFLPVLYSVCSQVGRRLNLVAALVAIFGAAIAAARVGRVVPPGLPVWQYRAYVTLAMLLAVTAAWGLGMSRMELLRREAEQRAEGTRTAVLAERSRIARDMHDVVAHSLAVIVRQAEGGALVAPKAPERAAAVLRTIADVGREALADMRGLVGIPHLASDAHLAGGAHPAGGAHLAGGAHGDDPEPGFVSPASLEDLPAVLERIRGAGVPVTLTEHGTRHDLGRAGELAVHHLVQEALTNTVKHAGPGARAEVVLEWRPTALVVEITDDGRGDGGGAAPSPVPGAGVGLRGLDDRISAVGGRLAAGPRGRGFAVRAVLPRRGTGGTA